MTPEEILSYPAKILTQEQREHYFEYGYVGIEDFVPSDILKLIKLVTSEFVEKSRDVTESNNVFDIGPGHSCESPVLRRLKSPDENHQEYWNFSKGLMADVASDLVGPNVTFHHSKLNFSGTTEATLLNGIRIFNSFLIQITTF